MVSNAHSLTPSKTAGLMQPIVVRSIGKEGDGTFELVAGERRWRAAQIAGLTATSLPLFGNLMIKPPPNGL